MWTLKIWFKSKHDDYNVAEILHQPDPEVQVRDMIKLGGFWYGELFIPLHCVSTVERIQE